MKSTLRIPLNNTQKSVENCVKHVIKVFDAGGVWVSPTDTIYGIHANALDNLAVSQIAGIKSRDPNRPYLLLIKDPKIAEVFANTQTPAAQNAFKDGWPLGITFVLRSKNPQWGGTVAMRIASDPLSKRLLEERNTPIVSTSANLSGKEYVDEPDAIFDIFNSKVDLVIDSGPLGNSHPSAIIDICGEVPVIVRDGPGAERFKNA